MSEAADVPKPETPNEPPKETKPMPQSSTLKIPPKVYGILVAILIAYQTIMKLLAPDTQVVEVQTAPNSAVSVQESSAGVKITATTVPSATPTAGANVSVTSLTSSTPVLNARAVTTATKGIIDVAVPPGWTLVRIEDGEELDPHDPRDVKLHDINQGERFYIPLLKDVKDYQFETEPANDVELMQRYGTEIPLLSVVTETPGRYVIFTAGHVIDGTATLTYKRKDVVQVGPVKPTPVDPTPAPPTPTPPAPVVTDDVGLRVLIVEETGAADYNITEPYHAINDKTFTAWLDANTRKEKGRPDWRREDKDAPLDALPKFDEMRDAAIAAGVTLPVFVVVNGKKGDVIKIPDTTAAAIAALTPYK